MSSQIMKLFAVIVVLFALLVVWTTRWTVIDATALNNNPLNSRTLITALKMQRGRILAANGEVLARSVKQKKTGYWCARTRRGRCSLRPSATPTSSVASRPGWSRYRLDDLKGPQTTLNSVFGPLGGNHQRGRRRLHLPRSQGPEARAAGTGRTCRAPSSR